MIKYSVIVAVFNRLEEVKELLESAEKLQFDRAAFEILFVDDGSSDGFRDMIHNYQSKSGLQIRAEYQVNQGPGAARNLGMKLARGTYFVFLDSDCMVPPDWLSAIDRAVVLENLDAFGGPDTYHPSFPPLLKAINYSMTSFLGTGGTRGSKKMVGRFYPRSFNMGIHRKVFDNIGGMNKLRHGQDMDFSARIYEAGYKVGLIADALVYHKRRTGISKFFRQIFNWGVARINLGRLHPDLLKPIHFLPALVLAGTIVLFVLAFLLKQWWPLLLVFGGSLMIGLLAFIQSFLMYGQLKTAFLSVITLHIQVFAYGMGLISALWAWKRGKEPKGFVKNYYGKG